MPAASPFLSFVTVVKWGLSQWPTSQQGWEMHRWITKANKIFTELTAHFGSARAYLIKIMTVQDKRCSVSTTTLKKNKQHARVISNSITCLQQISLLSKGRKKSTMQEILTEGYSPAVHHNVVWLKWAVTFLCKCLPLWAFSGFNKVEMSWHHTTLDSSSGALLSRNPKSRWLWVSQAYEEDEISCLQV